MENRRSFDLVWLAAALWLLVRRLDASSEVDLTLKHVETLPSAALGMEKKVSLWQKGGSWTRLALLASLYVHWHAANVQFWCSRPRVRLKVMSFNLRYDNGEDRSVGLGWDKRLLAVVEQIKRHRPDLIGTQEALLHQLQELKHGLAAEGMNYSYCGSARERFLACFPCGEHCAIFSQGLEPVLQGTFALSETPSAIGSRSWDTGCPRVATYAWFRTSSGCVLFLNTHLDHVSPKARALGAKLIVRLLDELESSAPCEQVATIISGDFNSLQHKADGTLEAPFSAFHQAGFRDACTEFGARDCPFLTYHGYKPIAASHSTCGIQGHRTLHGHIDWILWRGSLKLIDFKVDTALLQGLPPSDHFPIIATFQLSGKSVSLLQIPL